MSTEKKKNSTNFSSPENSMGNEKSLYQHIFEHAPIGIMHYNEEGIITACNGQFVEILGSTKEKLLGLNLIELPDEHVRESTLKTLIGKVGIYEGVYHATTSGKSVPVRVEFHPVKKMQNGKYTGIGMMQDISDRYYALHRLKESEERYRTIFTNSRNTMLLIDIDSGKIQDANRAAESFYGWSHDELTDKYIRDINIMSSDEIFDEMEKARNEEKNVFHFKHRLANNEVRDVEVFSSLVRVDGEHYHHSIIHDITERNKAEEDLKKFKLGIERSPNIIFITDKEGAMEYVNPSFSRIYGFDYDEAVGENPRILKSGLLDKKDYEIFWDTISSGNVMEGEIINRTKEGKFIVVRASSNPIVDDKNNIIGYLAIQEDITEQKEKDKQLQESLKEKEVLLSEIHHRVKNNLAIISGLLELNLYQEEVGDTEEIIRDSQQRIKAMANVHELLYESDSFSNISFKEYIEGLIESNFQAIESDFKKPRFVLEIEDVELNVNQAIPCGLVVNELIANSMKHAFKNQEAGTVEIKFLKDRDFIRLIVEDDGAGVPENIDPLAYNSLGMTLVKILSQQLEADLEIGNSEKGFKTTLVFEVKENLRGSSTTI